MKKVTTRYLIEELETDGHSPLKFICDDGSVYYVKYRSGKSFKKEEINCLVFEMICTKLLKRLNLPVPDEALVLIAENSYAPQQLKAYKRTLKPGVIGWGSKEIERTDLVREIDQIQRKRDFNRLLNPEQLIGIAIFDLWVDNADRHSENYNLITKTVDNKVQIISIDHAFTFGGLAGLNTFNEASLPSSYHKLIDSQYFKSITKHIARNERLIIGNEYLSLISELDIENLVNDVFDNIPPEWAVNPKLRQRINSFLQSKKRLNAVDQMVKSCLSKKFKTKKS